MQQITENDQNFICDIQAPCFQVLTEEEVMLVRSSRTQLLFRKGDTLTKQGAFASYVLFIIKGIARQYLEGEGNKSYNLRIIRPGEFVGLSSAFSSPTYNYSSLALTDCQAFLVEKSAIEKVAKQNGAFSFSIIKRYCEQNNNVFESLSSVLYKQMNGRLADVLLYLESIKPEYPEIFQLLSRREIADFAGISTESAVKLLKTLEKEEIICLKEKDIIINQPGKLEMISKNG